MKFLITGSSGFIGTRLLMQIVDKGLAKPDEIVLLTSIPKNGYKNIHYGDHRIDENVFISNNISKIDYVILLGAFTPKNARESNLISNTTSNISNLEQILSALTKARIKPKKVIFSSTLDVYDIGSEIINEKSIITPVSLYGESKYYCEKLLQHWSQQTGIAHVILRIGHIFGEGEDAYKKLIPITIKNVLNNKVPIIYGNKDDLRSFLYIDDCCSFILKSLANNVTDNIVNVVSDKSYSIIHIVKTIVELAGKGFDPTIEGNQAVSRSIKFDAKRLSNDLGYPETTLEEGLLREINWYKQNPKLLAP